MTTQHWTSETDSDGIVWLRLDRAESSANTLSRDVLEEFNSLIEPMMSNPPKGVVIHSGKPNGFVMGADINEFTEITTAEQGYELVRRGQTLFDRLENLACPTVAAINGFALGGGLELAMACKYRLGLAGDKKVLGLPEVQLGLHPGFGGTVRAVQICGVREGMQIQLTGKPITIAKGRKIGLIDRIATQDNWRQAAKELIAANAPKQRAPLLDRILNLAPVRPFIRKTLISQVAGKARKDHYPAPYAMIDLWAKHGASSTKGMEAEARSFAELVVGPTARNLVRVFFLQNKLKGQGGKQKSQVEHVHVVGAGVMGGDIAAWCALRGLSVTLQDREQKYIDPALERAAKLFAKRVRDDDKRAATSKRLEADVSGNGAAKADLVIEAIFENLEAKQNLYKDLQARMKPGALLATNTSSIRLEELRTVLDQPDRFIGLHFFNPVAMLPLVEVIGCADTSDEALNIGFGFVKAIGKFPLGCASAPGFVVNRVLWPYMTEAMLLAQEGVPLVAIDRAAEDFGMPMGPVELMDSVGLDVGLSVSKVLGGDMDSPGLQRLAQMVNDGNVGRKSGQGFYAWQNGKPVKPVSDGSAGPADMQDRLMLAMVNESVACLDEKVVTDPDLLDAGVIFGTGFAPFRGGPINYAREQGLQKVVKRLDELAGEHGERFAPHSGWSAL
jgi:3-hydroxyacyl-CoA dehydrogenase/enoyl-CoA hydratase/3-hydroxybutyryl-CoA epimerase